MKQIFLFLLIVYLLASCQKGANTPTNNPITNFLNYPGYLNIKTVTPSWITYNGRKCFQASVTLDTVVTSHVISNGISSIGIDSIMLYNGNPGSTNRVYTYKLTNTGTFLFTDTITNNTSGIYCLGFYDIVKVLRYSQPVTLK